MGKHTVHVWGNVGIGKLTEIVPGSTFNVTHVEPGQEAAFNSLFVSLKGSGDEIHLDTWWNDEFYQAVNQAYFRKYRMRVISLTPSDFVSGLDKGCYSDLTVQFEPPQA